MKAVMSFCLMAGLNEVIDPALPPAMVGRPIPVSISTTTYEGIVTKAEPIRQDGRTIGIEVHAVFNDFSPDRPTP